MLLVIAPISAPALIPANDPVGPRSFAPIAPTTPVAAVVTPNVIADLLASSKKFLPFDTSCATCVASISASAKVPSQ